MREVPFVDDNGALKVVEGVVELASARRETGENGVSMGDILMHRT